MANATTTKKTTKSASDKTSFESLNGFGPESFKEGYEKLAESVSSVAEFQKGSLEAVMASAGAFAKGFEKLANEQTAFLKAAYEDSVATAKAASASKSVQEAIEINSEFVRETMEKNLGQINKVADMWIETAKNSAEPLTERYSEMVGKIQAYRP